MKKPKLIDAQLMHTNNPHTFEVPSKEELSKIKKGSFVKICAAAERFWAKVEKVDGDKIVAIVDNDLVCSSSHKLYCGDEIELTKDNVYSIL